MRVPATSGATERGGREQPVAGDASPSGALLPAGKTPGGLNASPTAHAASPGRLHYLEALAAVSNTINATLELDLVLQLLVDRAAELLQVPATSVMLLERSGQVSIHAAHGLSPAYVQSQRGPLEQSVAGRALTEGRVFATWDARRGADENAAAAAREGLVSVACAPMLCAGEPVGALNLYCRREHCFGEDQLHVLALLAAQGAIAVTNARLYRRSRAQAAEVRASFERVGVALASSLNRAEILQLIVQLAGEMTYAEGGAMFMLADEREGGDLVLWAARGLERRSIRHFRRVPVSPLVARAWAEKSVLIVSDTRQSSDTPFPALAKFGEKKERTTRSAICVPIAIDDRPVGILELYAGEPYRFDEADRELLASYAIQAAVAIENTRLYAQERDVAQTLQRAFLPHFSDTVGGWGVGRIYAPANEVAAVGGDTYDLFPLPDGRIAAVIADVCGKGTFAATLTALTKYTTRAYALEDPDPSRVLARVNNALIPQTDDCTFVTLCYALLDPCSRSAEVASAAHPPVLLCRPGEPGCRPLGSRPGLIAGFRPDEEYPSESTPLQTGDILVFYTDGVLEARKRKNMFGSDRLEKVIAQNAGLSAQEIAAAIYAAVVGHTGDNLSDDLALLVLKAL